MFSASQEFDKQVDTLLQKGYPKLAGITHNEFKDKLLSLKQNLIDSSFSLDILNGKVPFVIVVKSTLVSTEKAMLVVDKNDKNGITKLNPLKPQDFETIPTVKVPNGEVYLLIDIDRGKETLNVTPASAFDLIISQKRSPLTIDEGVALVTHYPEFLIKNNCFSLLASRHVGDKRVPAIWINGAKNPNLGWCWNGNPHTWLGSASCSKRVGV